MDNWCLSITFNNDKWHISSRLYRYWWKSNDFPFLQKWSTKSRSNTVDELTLFMDTKQCSTSLISFFFCRYLLSIPRILFFDTTFNSIDISLWNANTNNLLNNCYNPTTYSIFLKCSKPN